MTAWRPACFAALAMSAASACGGGGSGKPDGGQVATGTGGHDASFSVCAGTVAVPFAAGVAVVSASGAYRATLQAASTLDATGAITSGAGIGHDTFTVAVTSAVDAADAVDGLTMKIPPVPMGVPADPYMPVHKHGGATIPGITAVAGQGGVFAVSDIDFFMGGYWELYLDLQPAGAATTDRVTFSICIATD
jgi:hypothetical protein